jgi:hypothetical protein
VACAEIRLVFGQLCKRGASRDSRLPSPFSRSPSHSCLFTRTSQQSPVFLVSANVFLPTSLVLEDSKRNADRCRVMKANIPDAGLSVVDEPRYESPTHGMADRWPASSSSMAARSDPSKTRAKQCTTPSSPSNDFNRLESARCTR